jgi:hypothetical protein
VEGEEEEAEVEVEGEEGEEGERVDLVIDCLEMKDSAKTRKFLNIYYCSKIHSYCYDSC